MKYLCTSRTYQELIEANDWATARTLMAQIHPDNGEYAVYAATDEDVRLFGTRRLVPLSRPKRTTPKQATPARTTQVQLDWTKETRSPL